MDSPIISFIGVAFKGDAIILNGSVDYQNGANGKVEYYLEPQPSGQNLGPFPLAVSGGTFSNTPITLGKGKWKIRFVASTDSEIPKEFTTNIITINSMKLRKVMPGVGGTVVTSTPASGIRINESSLKKIYQNSVLGVNAGLRRQAAITALINSMGNKQRLSIYQNNTLVVAAYYQGAMTADTDDSDVTLNLSTQQPTTILVSADLAIGKWTFDLQGGPNYSNSLSGTVGSVGSGEDMELSDSPEQGSDFSSEYTFVAPRELDGVI